MPPVSASEKAVAETTEVNVVPAVAMLDHAKRLFDLGCAALRAEQYDEACDCLSKALEIRVQQYGERGLECATSYYKYGCALLYKHQSESDALGPTGAAAKEKSGVASTEATLKTIDEDGEGTDDEGPTDGEVDDGGDEDAAGNSAHEDELDEGETDLQLAWEILDVARIIYENQPERCVNEVDVITALADISLEKEEFECCFEDYKKALQILVGLVEPDDRGLAQLYFKIALALQLSNKPKDALEYCKQAVSICESRLKRLKKETTKPAAETALVHGGKVDDESEATKRAAAEIVELDELLVDLREKVCELQEMCVAPSLMEALMASNPSAAASMKEVFSLMASVADGSPSSSNGLSASAVSSSTSVTDLGVVGRGVKRAAAATVSVAAPSNEGAASSTSGAQDVPRKRSLEDMMNGDGVFKTRIRDAPA